MKPWRRQCDEFTKFARKLQVLISVDTNVLLDQAQNDGDVLDALQTIRAKVRAAQMIITPTVLEELGKFSQGTDERAEDSNRILDEMLSWGYTPYPSIPIARGIVGQTALRIRAAGLVPEEEVNDSFVISEAAHFNCAMLLSTDSHLASIDRRGLKCLLGNEHASNPSLILASPREIVKKFFPSR